MNLTRRGPRFTFQKRVPSDLAERFGASPIRLPLPPCGAREAQRLAALLGGQLEVRFMEARLACGPEDEDPRDAVIRELMEMLEHAYATRHRQVKDSVRTVELRHLMERLREQNALRERLAGLDRPLHQIRDGFRKLMVERPATAPQSPDLARMEAALEAMQKTQEQLVAKLASEAKPEPAPTLPLFSEAFPGYLEEQVKSLPDSKVSGYTLPAARDAFIEIVGDKPILDYTPNALTAFARVLAGVPVNKAKLRRFADLTFEEAAAHNAGLAKPFPTLSVTTITQQYVVPVKGGRPCAPGRHPVVPRC